MKSRLNPDLAKGSFSSPLFWAALLAAGYAFCLAQVSGAPGGLVFLLTGWAIPTVINGLATAWLVGLLPTSRRLKVAAAVPVSFVIGLNTHLPLYLSDLMTPRDLSSWILRSVRYSPDTRMDVRLAERPRVNANPIGPPIEIDANGVCMCLFFTLSSPDWTERTLELLRRSTGRSVLSYMRYDSFPLDLQPGIYFDIAFEKDQSQRDKVEFVLDVYEGTHKIATFTQKNVHASPDISRMISREKKPNAKWFAWSVAELLAHGNIWSMFAPEAALQFPENELKDFIGAVLQRQGSDAVRKLNPPLRAPPAPRP